MSGGRRDLMARRHCSRRPGPRPPRDLRRHPRALMPLPPAIAAERYGVAHQRDRARWQSRLNGGETIMCRRVEHGCKAPTTPINPTSWDLGHPDETCPLPKAPEHTECNRRTQAGDRKAARTTPPPRWSL